MPLQKRRRQFLVTNLRGIALILGIFVGLLFAGSAYGATFPDACGGANNFDYAVCERVDYIAQHEDDNQQLFGWLVGAVIFAATVPIWREIMR